MTRHAEDSDNTDRSAVPVVMLLGSGEMSRELTVAFQRLGAAVIAIDRHADAPAHRVADRSAVVKMNDPEALAAVIEKERPDFVVVEAGAVATDALAAVAETAEVFPTPRATRLSLDREGLRRLAADELGLPTAPFWFAGSAKELAAVAEHAGFPLAVTPVAGAAGVGRSVLLRSEDVQPAWNRAIAAGHLTTPNRVMAETVVDVDDEVTLLAVRTNGPTGPAVHFCEPIGHRVAEDGTLATWQPHRLSPAALDAAKSIAARIVNSLGGRGAFSVELLVRGDEVYFSGVRPRPDDNAFLTVRTQRLSEFDLHARAILGLTVDTIMISPGAAEIGYAETATAASLDKADVLAVLSEALEVAESDVLLFDRLDETDGRHRLAAAFATAPDVVVARDRAQRTAVSLRRLWQS
jgi:phosphoribosylglycinamide formyltransferase 2